jgi:hypothetical protein
MRLTLSLRPCANILTPIGEYCGQIRNCAQQVHRASTITRNRRQDVFVHFWDSDYLYLFVVALSLVRSSSVLVYSDTVSHHNISFDALRTKRVMSGRANVPHCPFKSAPFGSDPHHLPLFSQALPRPSGTWNTAPPVSML